MSDADWTKSPLNIKATYICGCEFTKRIPHKSLANTQQLFPLKCGKHSKGIKEVCKWLSSKPELPEEIPSYPSE